MPKLGPHAKHAQKAGGFTEPMKIANLVKMEGTNPRRAFQMCSANFAQREKNLLTKVPLVVHALLESINCNRGLQGYLVYFARLDLPIQLQRQPVLNAPKENIKMRMISHQLHARLVPKASTPPAIK